MQGLFRVDKVLEDTEHDAGAPPRQCGPHSTVWRAHLCRGPLVFNHHVEKHAYPYLFLRRRHK